MVHDLQKTCIILSSTFLPAWWRRRQQKQGTRVCVCVHKVRTVCMRACLRVHEPMHVCAAFVPQPQRMTLCVSPELPPCLRQGLSHHWPRSLWGFCLCLPLAASSLGLQMPVSTYDLAWVHRALSPAPLVLNRKRWHFTLCSKQLISLSLF